MPNVDALFDGLRIKQQDLDFGAFCQVFHADRHSENCVGGCKTKVC